MDKKGEALVDPAAAPQLLAIEADSNLTWEYWDGYWRKLHGPRFSYEEPGSRISI